MRDIHLGERIATRSAVGAIEHPAALPELSELLKVTGVVAGEALIGVDDERQRARRSGEHVERAEQRLDSVIARVEALRLPGTPQRAAPVAGREPSSGR